MNLFSGKSNWAWEIDENTFDVIDVDFFTNHKFSTVINYILFLFFLILKIAFIGSDIYTAIKLIVFDKWSSDITPFISYDICRWIFIGCILLSVLLIVWNFIYGLKVYYTRNISLTYINPIARNIYCLRSYKYFCVYNEITSDNFFSGLVFFTYFKLRNCLGLICCDSPRQIINLITIIKILKFDSSMVSVIKNIAATNKTEAIILSLMTFSFIIWFIFFIEFVYAILFFLPIYYRVVYKLKFKYGLKQYCCIKINEVIQNKIQIRHSHSLDDIKKENATIYPRLPEVGTLGTLETPFSKFPSTSFQDTSSCSGSTFVDERASSERKNITSDKRINPFDDDVDFDDESNYRGIKTHQKTDYIIDISSSQNSFKNPYPYRLQDSSSSFSVLKPPAPTFPYNGNSSNKKFYNLEQASASSLSLTDSSNNTPFKNQSTDRFFSSGYSASSRRNISADELSIPPRSTSNNFYASNVSLKKGSERYYTREISNNSLDSLDSYVSSKKPTRNKNPFNGN